MTYNLFASNSNRKHLYNKFDCARVHATINLILIKIYDRTHAHSKMKIAFKGHVAGYALSCYII